MQKQNVEQVFSVWISVAKFLSCVDASHLLICNKSFTSLLSGIIVKWFITNRKNFGIDYTNPEIDIKIPFIFNNKVVFAGISHNGRFGFSVNDIVTNITFYDATTESIGDLTAHLTDRNTLRFVGNKQTRNMRHFLLKYVATIDKDLWEILRWR
jgi:hypothetical protein